MPPKMLQLKTCKVAEPGYVDPIAEVAVVLSRVDWENIGAMWRSVRGLRGLNPEPYTLHDILNPKP